MKPIEATNSPRKPVTDLELRDLRIEVQYLRQRNEWLEHISQAKNFQANIDFLERKLEETKGQLKLANERIEGLERMIDYKNSMILIPGFKNDVRAQV